ncbi:MAG: peptide ABC transporter substrate-binding protein [Candidatus Hydrogenedens sp.]|nr:peptide ABC transporter substrate-binding protein [Candidatus Hydrogenedens sp.]
MRRFVRLGRLGVRQRAAALLRKLASVACIQARCVHTGDGSQLPPKSGSYAPALQGGCAALLFVFAALLSGCGGRPVSDEMVIRAGNRSEVQDLDPHVVSGIAEFRALGALFEGLARVNPETLEPEPGVAASWDIAPDGVHYTFHLRDDARWSNGDPVRAQDFVFSWRRMLSPALASEYAYMLHVLKNGRAYNEGGLTDFDQVGVHALDDQTLAVELESPTPYFLSMQVHFSWFPVNPGVVEAAGPIDRRGTGWTSNGKHVGNGPYMLEDWRPDEVLRVVRNPNYWDAEHVRADAVEFYPISNEQTEEREFRSGKLDLTYSVPIHRIPVYQAEQPEVLVIAPYVQTYYYRFNLSRPPFDDARVREAFSLAIDRERLASEVLKAGERPAYSFTPPDTAGYTAEYRVGQDGDKARALLAEAGYPGGKGFPRVEILYNTAEFDKVISEAVQQMWKEELGVESGLRNQDYKVYLDAMSALDYDIARSTWLADVMDPINFLECFLTGSGNNRTGYSSEAFDGHIRAAYAEPDAAKREADLQAAEKQLLQDAPITPVLYMTQKFLKAERLKGLETNSLGYIRWQDLYIEDTK